ncbi:hypothetical protein EDD21DRAFT_113438 [Dissophora ornata]|nr:hypothetical protein EDD21DRAFT_113438 [Dissophora ornata]
MTKVIIIMQFLHLTRMRELFLRTHEVGQQFLLCLFSQTLAFLDCARAVAVSRILEQQAKQYAPIELQSVLRHYWASHSRVWLLHMGLNMTLLSLLCLSPHSSQAIG